MIPVSFAAITASASGSEAWFDAIDGDADDLVKVRREAIDWILRLR